MLSYTVVMMLSSLQASHLCEECQVFMHSESVKKDVMLWTEAQTAANTLDVHFDVMTIDKSSSTGRAQEPCEKRAMSIY